MTDRQRVGVDTTRRSCRNGRSDRNLSRPEVAAVRQRHSDCVIMGGGLGGSSRSAPQERSTSPDARDATWQPDQTGPRSPPLSPGASPNPFYESRSTVPTRTRLPDDAGLPAICSVTVIVGNDCGETPDHSVTMGP